MTDSTTEEQRTPPPQQLPGYELVGCLGTGAYGEVWEATAPGGLTKAIKYVFGQLEDKRATAEMKALERVKQVRHPYLLSLERIEVLDGRLIVVTELADESLRDRFRSCLQEGKPGIPRDELLRYMAEAAEALDYLASQHQLQHLDVKPENLLLLAGHTKVADFGLVKSMNDQAQSIVGGMTPIYAAPEVFQGSPSWRSDQYSLAVMYQELLTGTAPFSGTNAAELTMQHLKDTPNLAALGDSDRFAVSQALSKKPENRFASCVHFVEALKKAVFTEPASPAPSDTSSSTSPSIAAKTSGTATEVFSVEDETPQVRPSIQLDLPPVSPDAIHTAEPPELGAESFRPTPAAFIGLGGIGGQVLSRLAGKISQRLGTEGALPTLPMLYVDTDPQAIQQAGRGDGGRTGLTSEQTLLLSLRRAQEYRDKAPSMLKWLSRRWLYNVPRSLRTEGIRPLGRLALLDHARRAMQRVRATLASAIEPESFAEAADSGFAFAEEGLRVYVVASINGGAGSAMTTDMAYAARAILDRLGVKNASITGLMINGSLRGANRSELTRVNAYAWMTEFQHFLRSGIAYPGDESAGLPAHEAGVPVFDNAYLLDLGEGLDANQLAAGVDNAAEYLLQDTVAEMQRGIDACRQACGSQRGTLKTFSLQRTESAPDAERESAAYRLIGMLADSWCGDCVPATDLSDTDTSHLVRDAATLIGRLQLDSAGLVANCRAAVEQTSSLANNSPAKAVGFEDIAKALSAGLLNEIKSDLYRRIWDRGERLVGASGAVDWYHSHLASLAEKLKQLSTAVREELQAATTAAGTPHRLQVSLASLEVATLVTHELSNALLQFRERLTKLSDAFRGLIPTSAPHVDEPDSPWRKFMDNHLPTITREADELLAAELLASTTDWLAADGDASTQELIHHVRAVTDGLISRELIGVTTPAGVAEDETTEYPLPVIAQWGATVRRVVSAEAEAKTDNNPFSNVEQAVRVVASEGAACLVTECDGLSLPHVAAHLVNGRRDYAELATRVLTRRDIKWTSPIDPHPSNDAPSREEPSREPVSSEPIPTQSTPTFDSSPKEMANLVATSVLPN